MRRAELTKLAKAHGWSLFDWQENIGMASYTKGDMRINVYTTKMTVATCLNHPKQGKTQMFRKRVTPAEMKKIFQNPRQHTGKGYQTK